LHREHSTITKAIARHKSRTNDRHRN
jgi:hypothetical protein